MKSFKPILSGKGLLAASIALMSTSALAETAGRVSFVTGDVTATSANGTTRALRRGDTINGGDKISTRAGRLQIRFTDGGFVSLQPNSVFGVDEYLYANRKPEESSLFFSLLQGGMRTITGAIGKVNKQSYKVRTPVATIGIRGTGYRARLDENGTLLVSVGTGFVNVSNSAGDITAGAGQNISALGEGTPPRLTDETADISASGVNGDQEEQEQLAEQNSQDDENQDTIAVTDLQDDTGYTEIVVSDGTGAYLLNTDGSSNSIVHHPDYDEPINQGGGTNPVQTTTLTNQQLVSPSLLGVHQGKSIYLNEYGGLDLIKDGSGQKYFERGGMAYSTLSPNQAGDIYWGRLTAANGNPDVDSLFDFGGTGSLATIDWIVGAPLTNTYSTGTATYSLLGGTATNKEGAEGSISQFDLTYNFSSSLMDVLLEVVVPEEGNPSSNITYTAIGTGVSVAQPSPEIFSLSSGLMTTSTHSTACSAGTAGCNTEILGFFSGNANAQIGASYRIDGVANYGAYGVAALGRDSYTPGSGSSTDIVYSGYYFSSPNTNETRYEYDVTLNANFGLVELADANNIFFNYGDMVTTGESQYGNLKWGSLDHSIGGNGAVPDEIFYGADNFPVVWIAGAPLTNAYTSGSATYTMQSALVYSKDNGNLGGMDSFNFTFNFASGLADVDMSVWVPNAGSSITYSAIGTGLMTAWDGNAFFLESPLDVTATGSYCQMQGDCITELKGFFSGDQNQQVAISFNLYDYSLGPGAYGVVALDQDVYTPALIDVLPDSVDDPLGPSSSYSPTYSFLGMHADKSGNFTLSPVTIAARAFFDQSSDPSRGALIELGNSNGTSFENNGLYAQGVGTDGALSWGKFSAGSASKADAFGVTGPQDFSSNTDYMAYIVGSSTPSNQLPSTGSVFYFYDTSSHNGVFKGVEELQKLEVTFNFDFASINLDMIVKADSSDIYTVSTLGPVGISTIGNGTLASSYFNIDESALIVEVNGSSCLGCSGYFAGFFAGDTAGQLGVSFAVKGYAQEHIFSGVAGLWGDSIPFELPETGYSIAYSYYNEAAAYLGDDRRGEGNTNNSQTLVFDSSNGLETVSNAEHGGVFIDRQALATNGIGNSDNLLHWGRWYNDSSTPSAVTIDSISPLMGDNDYLHYIAGAKTDDAFIYGGLQSGMEATYDYWDGTEATDNYGNTGTLSGQLKAQFGSSGATLGVDLNLVMSDFSSYNITTDSSTLISMSGSGFSTSSLIVTGTGGACNSYGCSAEISGFFAGAQAQQIGLSYHITDDITPGGNLGNSQASWMRNISGVAAFGRGDFEPVGTGPGVGGL